MCVWVLCVVVVAGVVAGAAVAAAGCVWRFGYSLYGVVDGCWLAESQELDCLANLRIRGEVQVVGILRKVRRPPASNRHPTDIQQTSNRHLTDIRPETPTTICGQHFLLALNYRRATHSYELGFY